MTSGCRCCLEKSKRCARCAFALSDATHFLRQSRVPLRHSMRSSRRCWAPVPRSVRAASLTATRVPRWRRRSARVTFEEARGLFPMTSRTPHQVTVGTSGPGGPTKGLLRFLTCGSVDDGKSTLIGRLLYDTKLILEDQLAALREDSRKHGATGDEIDFALLVDGLEAEREQGITIDVAYRFFATPHRSFIVADTPGHEQYTRNMATGASNADLAVILIDARKGVLVQTR